MERAINKSRFALAIDLYVKCVSPRYMVIYIDPLPGTYAISFVLYSYILANNLLRGGLRVVIEYRY